MKKIFFPILLICLSIVSSLFLAEMLLRIFWPQPLYCFEKGLFIQSKEYGYCFAPLIEKTHNQPEYSYIIKTNSCGFRGKEPNFNANFRILILGDSFGMGQGVGEGKNLCELSQSYFNKQGIDVGIFNTSISGYSGINELKVLRKWINDYKPNLVILLFHWTDIKARRSLFVQDGYLVLRPNDKSTMIFREWANNHSHLYCLIKRFYYIQQTKKPLKRNLNIFNEPDVKYTTNNILEMKKICDAYHAIFTVILLPWDAINKDLAINHPVKNNLVEQLKTNSISFRDWSFVLPNQDRQSIIYKIDSHWNEKGHLYFSRYLNEIITDALKLN